MPAKAAHKMSERTQRIVAPILILVIILILWEGLVNIFQIEQFILPKPSAIIENLIQVESRLVGEITGETTSKTTGETVDAESELRTFLRIPLGVRELRFVEGENLKPILQASWFTLKEALGGLAMGGTGGILMALATARWTATREALLPFAIAANSMPIIAFAPIMNNWFGIDNPFSKMAIVAIMVFFPIMINTVRGLVSADTRSVELMRSYASSEFEVLRKLRIPTALPFFFSGLKVAASLSMIGAIVGEYFGGPRIALGVYITQEAALFRFDSAWSAIIIACLLGITLYLLILVLERLFMPWHISFRS